MHTGASPVPPKVCVVIPAYKVAKQILQVLKLVGPGVAHILVIDDCCPEGSGEIVRRNCKDERVEVIRHERNLGVGGAVITGYRRSLALDCDIVVKLDGDGQMDPSLISKLIHPLIFERAGYSKGNRFFNIEAIRAMPLRRILGNLVLSFMAKGSTGYWKIFDPNNGYTAIKSDVLANLPLEKVDSRYFFESDMLFRLYLARVVIADIPMPAIYKDEKSNLKIGRTIFEFSYKHFRNTYKRILYTYYLREFTLASIELPLGLALFLFGLVLGTKNWLHGLSTGIPTQPGTLILIAMSILSGLQLLLSFLSYDISNAPTRNGSYPSQ